ncbi:MAG: DUF1080 domain-containing protein [Bacteroidota bacterium]
MKTFNLFVMMILGGLLCGCSQTGNKKDKSAPETKTAIVSEPEFMNRLSDQEKVEGWLLLFDGVTTRGWKNYNQDTLTGWIVEDGCLKGLGLGGDIGGDIVSVKEYGNFILTWDWKLGPHGNSGVMYHVIEDAKYAAGYETGPEYQLIEDDDFRDERGKHMRLKPWQKTGADYAMYVASADKQVNLRDWNSSIIMFTPEKAEYWLNGRKVVEFVPWSDDWNQRRNSGKWDDYPDYGLAKSGKLCLQDHGSQVWFRNIKIKEL